MRPVVAFPLRLIQRLMRWALALFGLALGFTAVVWAVLHLWIMPRLDDWRPAMQAWASERLGVPVQIAQMSAQSNGWQTVFSLQDVAIQGRDGQAALRVPRLKLVLSPVSLWRQSVDRLVLQQPSLEIWRDKSGRLWLGGLAVPDRSGETGTDLAMWDALLKARRLGIENGSLHWRDELLGSPGLTLSAVEMDWRNRSHHHQISLSARPPEDWGAPFAATADLRTPLLRPSSVRGLSGKVLAQFPDLRLTALRRHVDAGLDLQAGQGALTVSAQVASGALKQLALEGEVSRIQARFAKDLTPLDLRDVAGRLVFEPQTDGFVFSGEGLRFVAAGGLTWNDAKVRVQSSGGDNANAKTELTAERVNLAALRHVLGALPLDSAVRTAMRQHAVTGWVKRVGASWSRDADGAWRYASEGQISDLSVAAAERIPGLKGLDVDFSFNEQGGSAQLAMRDGRLSFPGVFQEPDIPVQSLSSAVVWQLAGDDWTVRVKDLKLRNEDAQGEFQAEWRTLPEAQRSEGVSRFPGVLDLTGHLSRANGARVHRYLPVEVGAEAIHYVREAVQSGHASGVTVRVQGDLHHFPFADGREGIFRIEAPVKGVRFNYVPAYLQHSGEPAWPALQDLQGVLIFEGAGMRVQGASGRVQGFPEMRFDRIEAHIPDLEHTQVQVQAQGQADVQEGLRFAQISPVAQWLSGALDEVQGNGRVGIRLGLKLPIAHIQNSQVEGDIVLNHNDVSLLKGVPRLSAAQGRVRFTEHGFALQDVQAQSLGGAVQLSGGTEAGEQGHSRTVIQARGLATAQGMQVDPALDFLQPLLRHAKGETPYQVRYAVESGQVSVGVQSELQGIEVTLPAPLGKVAGTAWPLQLRIAPKAGGDELNVNVSDWLALRYVRDALPGQTNMRVRAGLLALGADAVAAQRMPAEGVHLQVQLPSLDVAAWRAKLDGGGSVVSGVLPQKYQNDGGEDQYLPKTFDLKLGGVHDFGRVFRQVRLTGAQQAGIWKASLQTDAAAGQLSYAPQNGGRLSVHLKHLHVPAATEIARWPESASAPQPGAAAVRWPSLDVAVDDLRVGRKQLGRLNVQGSHRSGADDDGTWVLKSVGLESPGGHLQASGAWLPPDAQGRRETRLQFELVVNDGGQLLTSLEMPGLVRGSSGVLHGVLSWQGTPVAPSLLSLKGQVHAELVKGQFLKADPGLAKLLGVLSLQSLPRRFSMDFRDVFSEGFAFDFIRGDAQVEAGVARTNNLQMKGVNAAVLMDGQANLQAQTQNLRVLVVPRIDAGGAALVATMINPAVGLGTFVAQLLLSQQINEAATRTLHITGSWAEPQVQQLPGNALPNSVPLPPLPLGAQPAAGAASAS